MAAIVEGKYLRHLEGASDDKIYFPCSPVVLTFITEISQRNERQQRARIPQIKGVESTSKV